VAWINRGKHCSDPRLPSPVHQFELVFVSSLASMVLRFGRIASEHERTGVPNSQDPEPGL